MRISGPQIDCLFQAPCQRGTRKGVTRHTPLTSCQYFDLRMNPGSLMHASRILFPEKSKLLMPEEGGLPFPYWHTSLLRIFPEYCKSLVG